MNNGSKSIRETDIYKTLEGILNCQRESYLREGFPSAQIRIDRLDRISNALIKYADRICDAVYSDYGARVKASILGPEVFGSLGSFQYVKENLSDWMKEEIKEVSPGNREGGCTAKVIYQPLGVVGIISPWNFPINLAMSPLAYVFAAGNRAMIKPSSKTPASAEVMKEFVKEYFDQTELAVITGTGIVNDAFCSLPFDKIIFTGSPDVAHKVMQAASDNLVPTILELGGKNPVIVGKEADLDYTVETIMAAKVANSGQVCMCADHVFIPKGMEEIFIQKARRIVADWFPTIIENDNYGSLINKAAYMRLLSYLQEAKENKVRVELLSDADEDFSIQQYNKFPLTILVNPPDNLKVMEEEIFGPIMPLITYTELEDVIIKVNSRPRPLALYYFGTDQNNIRMLEERTTSGAIGINDFYLQGTEDTLPFGGVGRSGMGVYHSREGFVSFSHTKTVVSQGLNNPLRTASYPPNAEAMYQNLKKLL